MIDSIDLSLINWSRAQFALTAMYHWLFVPLTLGLSVMLIIMETRYVRTGSQVWKKITRFWMKLFGINFAIGVSTGIILEFEFGTNWSNYSWFVGDIFGAPLAIEGIMAFFMESTFIAIMFFGWEKVSRKWHLASTWLTAIGANLSALWILVANSWMENPVGMVFNPETARNEMHDFAAVLFNPVALDKFSHTVTSGFVLASLFVIGISSWFLLKGREKDMAIKSIKLAAVFGFISSLILIFTGDTSARTISRVQPVKFAAMEALFEGETEAGLAVFGILKAADEDSEYAERDMIARIELPGFLSMMTHGDVQGFVPGIRDLIEGNEAYGILPVSEKISRGRIARDLLTDYKEAVNSGEELLAGDLKERFTDKGFQEDYFRYFGYAFIEKPADLIPNVPIVFYSFHIMVGLGFMFIIIQLLAWYFVWNGKIVSRKWFLRLAVLMIPLAYIASQAGWIVAEVGRQPWIIQDLMPVTIAVSQVSAGAVQTTFILFAVLFTALLLAEISIMRKQIVKGPQIEEE